MSLFYSVDDVLATYTRIFSSIQLLVNKEFFATIQLLVNKEVLHQSSFKLINTSLGKALKIMGSAFFRAGSSIPSETMMHFPLFQISPYFRKNFEIRGKFSQFYLFPTNFLIFIRRNF